MITPRGSNASRIALLVGQRWSEYTTELSGRNAGLFWWQAGPEISRHSNRKISGDPNVDWIRYTLSRFFGGKLPLARCLSLGCGDGNLERSLARHHAFEYCDACDVAEGSVQLARKKAEEEGIGNINYYVADINRLVLPNSHYDAVWIHSALHHFEALEHVFKQIRQALKPEGLLILNEYIGPNQFQFSSRQKEVPNACLRILPLTYRAVLPEAIELQVSRAPFKGRRTGGWLVSRVVAKCRDGDLWGALRRRFLAYRAKLARKPLLKLEITFPSVNDVLAADPSEAIRSADIVGVLGRDFEILERKDLGGNLLQFLLAGIAGNFSEDDDLSQTLLRLILSVEDTLVECGELKSDFAYVVARPMR